MSNIIISTWFLIWHFIGCLNRCTIIYGTPTMYKDLMTVCEERSIVDSKLGDKMACVEILHSGGAMCFPETMTKLRKHFKNSRFMVCKYYIIHFWCKQLRSTMAANVVRLWFDRNHSFVFFVHSHWFRWSSLVHSWSSLRSYGGEHFIVIVAWKMEK